MQETEVEKSRVLCRRGKESSVQYCAEEERKVEYSTVQKRKGKWSRGVCRRGKESRVEVCAEEERKVA